MNHPFDELTKSLAQSVTRRGALKKLGPGLAGMALACFGLANKAVAARPQRGGYCQIVMPGFFTKPYYNGVCMDIHGCISAASVDCPADGTLVGSNASGALACGHRYDSSKKCSFSI